jgi:hypothetical protein
MNTEILGTPQTPPWGCAPWTPASVGGSGTPQTPPWGCAPWTPAGVGGSGTPQTARTPLVEVMQ